MKISTRDLIISCGIIPVKIINGEPIFLLLRAWSNWDHPKGKKEKGESDIEAAIRETKEEADIDAENLNFRWGEDYYQSDPYRKKKDKVVRYFVAETTQEKISLPINPEIGKAEHQEFRWVDYTAAKKLTNERVGKAIDWAYNKIKG